MLKRKRLGKKYFEGKVNVTDPGYDKDTWCRMDVEVKAGNYTCNVWMHTEMIERDDNTKYKDVRVGIIGIHKNGRIPCEEDMCEIGTIGVDAGLAGFFMNKPDYNDEEWSDFCDRLYDGNDAWIIEEGFFSHSGYGDGVYPVYAAYDNNNEVVALEIRFM